MLNFFFVYLPTVDGRCLKHNNNNRDVMVSFSELELANMIGSGAAGTVWRGAWRGAAVAVKVPFVIVNGRMVQMYLQCTWYTYI